MSAPDGVLKVVDIDVLIRLDRLLKQGYSLEVHHDIFGKDKHGLAMMYDSHIVAMVPKIGIVTATFADAIANSEEMPDDTGPVLQLIKVIELDQSIDKKVKN